MSAYLQHWKLEDSGMTSTDCKKKNNYNPNISMPGQLFTSQGERNIFRDVQEFSVYNDYMPSKKMPENRL